MKKRSGDAIVVATLVITIVSSIIISGWSAWETHRQASWNKVQALQGAQQQPQAPAQNQQDVEKK